MVFVLVAFCDITASLGDTLQFIVQVSHVLRGRRRGVFICYIHDSS
jgi:hypothetical protein